MKITSAEVIVTSPSRNFVTLKLTTDEGVIGLGDATVNGRELAVAAYLRDHVAPLLIGRDPHRIEDTWQYLYRGAYWRRGPITMAAIACGRHGALGHQGQGRRAAGLPAARRRLAQWPAGLRPRVRERRWRPLGVDPRAPGEGLPRGPGTDRCPGDPRALRGRRRSLRHRASVTTTSRPGVGCRPVEEDWDTAAYMRHVPGVFEAVRQEFGPELPLLHDAHHRLTPIEAAKLGQTTRALRPLLARGLHARREPAGAATRAPAHHHATRRSVRCSTRSGTSSS